MDKTVLILAAGIGTRYGSTKQIAPIGQQGEIIIDYSLHDAILAGFTHAVIVIRRELLHDITTSINTRFCMLIHITYVFQDIDDIPHSSHFIREKPWGTTHAVWVARTHIHTPFIVINADDFYSADAFVKAAQFINEHYTNKNNTDYGLLSYPLINTLSPHGPVSRGICTIYNSYVTAITEYTHIHKTDNAIESIQHNNTKIFTGHELVSVNFFIFTPDIFPLLEKNLSDFFTHYTQIDSKQTQDTIEAFITDMLNNALSNNTITIHNITSNTPWFGITYPDDIHSIQSRIELLTEKGFYSSPLKL